LGLRLSRVHSILDKRFWKRFQMFITGLDPPTPPESPQSAFDSLGHLQTFLRHLVERQALLSVVRFREARSPALASPTGDQGSPGHTDVQKSQRSMLSRLVK